jgi:tripartite-type tricarboxylate transporter receptor subunit TctC
MRQGLLALLFCALGAPVAAQVYPARPVHLIIEFAAGGGADFVGRIVGEELSEALGQPFVIDNRPGATGAIANAFVAKSPADGYTLLLGAMGSLAIAPHINPASGFDALTDFAPVSLAATSPFAVTLAKEVPARNLAELIALAKARPGQLNYGTSGNGTAPHLATELFESMGGVELVHVPYKGLAPALLDLVGGQIQVVFADVGLVLPHARAGTLKPIAVTGAQRSPTLPDVPTVAEAGLSGYRADTWYGVFAPKGTPPAIIARLNAEMRKLLAKPSVRERMASQGIEAAASSSEQFGTLLHEDFTKWQKVVRDAKIKAN